MSARRAAAVLLVCAISTGFASEASANDWTGDMQPIATNTCDTAACRLHVLVPGQAANSNVQGADSSQAETPTCLVIPVAELPTNLIPSDAGPNAGNQLRRECFLHNQLVSSQAVPYTVEPEAPPTVSLAKQAYGTLVPPQPMVQMSPGTDVPQLTGLPTWLFLKSGSWGSTSASASAGGVTVTATAVPQTVNWSIGDGGSVTCQGPGTPYSAQSASASPSASSSPDCGYTYRRTSAGMPGGVFDVTVTTSWRVDWHGGGRSGSFPDLRSSVHVPVRVIEASALVTAHNS
jgi:hypothetical protein